MAYKQEMLPMLQNVVQVKHILMLRYFAAVEIF